MSAQSWTHHIVLLSDNAFKRKLAKLALQSLGARVIEAASEAAARRAVVEEIGVEQCSAIVVALRDVDAKGIGASANLREAMDAVCDEDSQPAIALVADRRDDLLRTQAADAGVDFTLIEPVDWTTFVERLDPPPAARISEDDFALDDEPLAPLTADAEDDDDLSLGRPGAPRGDEPRRGLFESLPGPVAAVQAFARRREAQDEDRSAAVRDGSGRPAPRRPASEEPLDLVEPAQPGLIVGDDVSRRRGSSAANDAPPMDGPTARSPTPGAGRGDWGRPPQESARAERPGRGDRSPERVEPPVSSRPPARVPPAAAVETRRLDDRRLDGRRLEGGRLEGADAPLAAERRRAIDRAAGERAIAGRDEGLRARTDRAAGPPPEPVPANRDIASHRFLWRPEDDAFVCGADAARALALDSDARSPQRLADWLIRVMSPSPRALQQRLVELAEDGGEDLIAGAAETRNGRRVGFGLFVERRIDKHGRKTLVGAAHPLASAAPAPDAVQEEAAGPALARLSELLEADREEGWRCAVYAIELLDFVEIDDGFGVVEGDRALRLVAERLRGALGPHDLLAARRRGGFLAVQDVVGGLDDVRSLGARLTAAAGRAIDIGGKSLRLPVSVGAAVGPDHGEEPVALISAADCALREARRKGAAHLQVYNALTREPARARDALKRESAAAIRDGAFSLNYMPALDVRGSVASLEAQLRLRIGEGRAPSDEAVDLDEVGADVDAFVRRLFEMAAKDLALWRHALGQAPKLAVNLDAAALIDGDLLRQAARALEGVGAPLTVLRLQITDRRIERRRAEAVDALTQARAAGVEIALDGFGTREAGVDAVAGFEFDRVKIAASLTARAGQHATPGARREGEATDPFGATVALARAFGLDCSAGGVSDPAARARVYQLGCDEAQGVAVAPSAEVTELVSWFSRSRTVG